MKDIILITKKNCPLCKRTKALLDKNNVIYRCLDAEEDLDGMSYVHYYGLGGSVLPRIIINDDLLPAYDTLEETLNAVLKAIGLIRFTGSEAVSY